MSLLKDRIVNYTQYLASKVRVDDDYIDDDDDDNADLTDAENRQWH